MTGLKIIDELLCRLQWVGKWKPWDELRLDHVVNKMLNRLERDPVPTDPITLSLSMYFRQRKATRLKDERKI